jgi:hypothetical protein
MAGRTSFWQARRRDIVKLLIHPAPWVAIKTVANSFTQPRGRSYEIPRAPGMRFLRHGRIYQSDVGLLLPQLGPGSPPPAGRPRTQAGRARREDRGLPIVSMSSGRLFLDRVGRHQSPSPLYRHEQNTMHFAEPRAKGDISTLPGRGHFYFALTMAILALSTPNRNVRFSAK